MIDLIQRSTIHGVNHIYSSKNQISKFLWLLLFLFGIGGINVNIVFIILKYVSFPVIVSYTVNHEPFIWPDLTFCSPTNPYNFATYPSVLSHWEQVFNESRETIKMLENQTEVFRIIHNFKKLNLEFEERTVVMASTDPHELKIHNFLDQFKLLSYSKLHSGMYYFREFDDKMATPFDGNLGPLFTTQTVQIRNNMPCHTFHTDRLKDVLKDDVKMLRLNMLFDYESYKIFNSSYGYRAIWLYINNKKEIPRKPIIVMPGFINVIRLTQSHHISNGLRRPCRQELFKVQLYDALLQSTSEYEGDEEDCKAIISQKLFVHNCGCYSPFLPIYKNESGFPRICLNATMFSQQHVLNNANCMVKVFKKYGEKSVFNIIFEENCRKYEPIKCNLVAYKVDQRKDMSIEEWSNNTNNRRRDFLEFVYESNFNKKIEKNFIYKLRDSLLLLEIYRRSEYGDMYKEQREYPFSELLSDIGGLMGLWLGMSVVGLFEVAEYFFLYVKGLIVKHPVKADGSEDVENCDGNMLDTV